MKKFIAKSYTIESEKIKGNTPVKLALLSDLHGLEFGEKNALLFEAIDREKPDAVLVAGDMIVRSDERSCEGACALLLRLIEKYPVYYALGNHEYGMLFSEKREEYLSYEKTLTQAGVCFLHNEKTRSCIRGTEVVFYGLELPWEFYKKPCSPKLKLEDMERLLGTADDRAFGVLLAHNPKYGGTYFSWGADLTLSGHYHGGIVRLSEHHGLSCPQYLFLPPYCCGDFHKYGRHMIVSAGIGEHTVPLRIHNPRELLLITLRRPETRKTVAKQERKKKRFKDLWQFP